MPIERSIAAVVVSLMIQDGGERRKRGCVLVSNVAMVVVEFLVPHLEAEVTDARRDHARTDVEVVLVASPTIQIAQAQAAQLGFATGNAFGRIETQPASKHIVAQLAGGAIEG